MKPIRTLRFSMATAMVAVVAAALASAVFARAREHIPAGNNFPYLAVDVPAVFVLSIALTAVALGALKAHSPKQIMLQIILAYLSYLGLILLAEAGAYRPLLYWFQASFALQAVLPLIARSHVKAEMERGPRRDWWKKTTEAILFSLFTVTIVVISSLLQWLIVLLVSSMGGILKF